MFMFIYIYIDIIFIIPQTSIALGVLAALLEDKILWAKQYLRAGTGLCGLQGASRGLPRSPAVSRGLPLPA